MDALQKQADTVGLLLHVDENIGSLRDYKEKVTLTNMQVIDGVTAGVDDIIDQLNVLNDEGEEMLETCIFLLEHRGDGRKQQMAQRYQRSKISGKLMLGGFGVGYAKLVAEKLKSMQDDCKAFTNPDEINYQVPMRWAAPDEKFGDRLVCHLTEYTENSAVSVESSVSNLSNKIVEQTWMGALAEVDHSTAVEDPSSWSGQESWMPELIGSCACLSAFSKFAWRHGPNAYPLPGMGG